jgi:DNA repair protein RecO (recombination protein O)
LVAEFYTKDHGKSSGIIFGGSSKKIKNYLQIGNRIHINFSSKSVNRVGYFKVEIQDAISPYFFDDQKKLSCILSAMNLIRILTADSQKNNLIYHLIENFYVILKKDNWLKSYIYWELELLKLIGFDLEFENLVEKNISNKQIEYTSKSIDKRIIPNFLVDKNDNIEDKETLLNGLKLVGDYLDKTILKPNNLNHPISRIQFINTLK